MQVLGIGRLGLLVLLLCLGGCRTLSYYGQALHGQAALWWQRRPIAQVVADPATPRPLVAKLVLARAARAYASAQLDLPRNRSYTSYVQLQRRFVVWNVFATAADSVAPRQHCFPIAGCVGYLGYFSHAAAEREAARLRRQGDDVEVDGVAAYSTLGWFADPVLSSMLVWSDDDLVGTLFHELAHQRLYLPGDTAFNESYASFVERQGLKAWRHSRGQAEPDPAVRQAEQAFTRQVLQLREQLRQLYARQWPAATVTAAKAAAFAGFRARYRQQCRQQGGLACAYRGWVDGPLNNASLLPFGLYDQWLPAFAHLFASVGGQWAAFHDAARAWSRLPPAQREAVLRHWSTVEPAATAPRISTQQP